MIEVVRDALRMAGLRPGDRLVIGLSGGIDSQVLTHLLLRLHELGEGPDLRLAHVDHRLRPASAEDARAVERIAQALALPLDLIHVDVDAWRLLHGQGVEAAARAARYAALAQAAKAWDSNWVAVGHNLDDQVETVLLRLARGAGPDGLAGMRLIAERTVPLDPTGSAHLPITLLRPLLSVRRSEIEAYAATHRIVPVEDESNADPRFRRNAVRHELIPTLERIVPGASESIARNADLLADDSDLLSDLAVAAFNACSQTTEHSIRLERGAFRDQPAALQRRIILLGVRAVAGEIELTRERVDAVRHAALDGAAGRRIEISQGVSAFVDYDSLLIGPDDRLEAELRRQHQMPELTPATTIAIEQSISVSAGPYWVIEIAIGCDSPGWVLRTRRPGDRLLLPGGRHRRLQDWLVDRKVPVLLRNRLPLLVYNDEVRWVGGVSTPHFEDVHSRLTARLETKTGDAQRNGQHASDD
jgi:tRNA(Ile)-lysidine synthetase-like protein